MARGGLVAHRTAAQVLHYVRIQTAASTQRSLCRGDTRAYSAQAAGPAGNGQKQPDSDDVDAPAPSAASTVGLMAVGALGAIGIAAVGVYGVLQLSLMVAQGTGRSIMADKQKSEAEQNARSQPG
ncbi:hypothetical protein CVIRNUC_011082 [Coccomyxa viridis]|uniref:Uncharacterized protein n=1 Tax=Coccomyxa viridis TaxID=1274662 RepID=A0AAV1INL0_9CHLO|nr:hypothetical protein CVIRNUC_011082 [Coccomyxa viridis]